jgi:hypothetical protein
VCVCESDGNEVFMKAITSKRLEQQTNDSSVKHVMEVRSFVEFEDAGELHCL